MAVSESDQIKLNKWVQEMTDEYLLDRLVEYAQLDGVLLAAVAVELRLRFKQLKENR